MGPRCRLAALGRVGVSCICLSSALAPVLQPASWGSSPAYLRSRTVTRSNEQGCADDGRDAASVALSASDRDLD